MAYLKKVNDAKTDSGVGGGWFKIAEDGFDGSKWGVDRLIANQGVQTVTIPSCIAPGQYLLRGELIALHSASSPKGAQFYMVSCAFAGCQLMEGDVLTMKYRSARRSTLRARVRVRRLLLLACLARTVRMTRVSCSTCIADRRRIRPLVRPCSSARCARRMDIDR